MFSPQFEDGTTAGPVFGVVPKDDLGDNPAIALEVQYAGLPTGRDVFPDVQRLGGTVPEMDYTTVQVDASAANLELEPRETTFAGCDEDLIPVQPIIDAALAELFPIIIEL